MFFGLPGRVDLLEGTFTAPFAYQPVGIGRQDSEQRLPLIHALYKRKLLVDGECECNCHV
jgi:hypothetical protein